MRPVEANGARYYVAEGSLDATEALCSALPEKQSGPLDAERAVRAMLELSRRGIFYTVARSRLS